MELLRLFHVAREWQYQVHAVRGKVATSEKKFPQPNSNQHPMHALAFLAEKWISYSSLAIAWGTGRGPKRGMGRP